MKLANTKSNNTIVQALAGIKQTKWNGNTIHASIDDCLTAMNLQSTNSGLYKPAATRIPKLTGSYMINEGGGLFFEARIIKDDEDKFRIEYLSIDGYSEFEAKYYELI